MDKMELREWLLYNLEDAKLASAGKQICCKCHNCDDHGRHLYIGPFDDSDTPIMYQCMRCPRPFKGVVNKNFLDAYKTVSQIPEEILAINNTNSSYVKQQRKAAVNGRQINLNRSYITDAPLTRQKLDHINQRLGTSLTYQDCIDNKIVLNLGDIYRANQWLTKFTRADSIVEQLDKYFIGFLSRSNSSFNMRNLVYGKGIVYESIDKKYINYNLFSETPEDDFYILPVDVNPYINIGVHIAEGPFDVLGIKYNVIGPNVPNQIFIAGKGKAYDKIVNFLLTRYGFINMTLNYYPDKDVSNQAIFSVCEKYNPYGFDQFIFRNDYPGEKDFGVPKDRIIVTKFSINNKRDWKLFN